MGLITGFGGLVKSLSPGNVSFLGSLLGGRSGRSFSGKIMTQWNALQVAAVYACVRNLSEDVAKLKPSVYRLKKVAYGSGFIKEVAKNHDLQKLFRRPNIYQDRFQFFETLMYSLVMRGNGYIFIQRDTYNGKPTALIPIQPDRVAILESTDGQLFYRLSPNGQFEAAQTKGLVTVPARDIIHVRGLSADGLRGFSVLEAAANAFSLASTAEQQQEGLFARGARPGGMLLHPTTITKEAADRLLENWENNYGTGANAGKSVLLEEGMEWKPLGMTSVDAEFLATRRFSVEEIARFFRMPLHMIGQLDKSTNNNIAHQGLEYYTNTLSGYLERIEAAFENAFDFANNDYMIEFDVWALMRLDLGALTTALATAKQAGLVDTNEAREKLGWNAREGHDELLQPLNMGTMDDLKAKREAELAGNKPKPAGTP